ncbi:MAG: sigma-70 family RNA polymerase sigma factor [Phycisphaerae bacterium]
MKRAADQSKASDAELVSRAQRGDPAAFGELVEKYQHRVYNTCYRMCHNHADALDLTQSAFLKALEALPRFQVRATFFTWLFRITVNLVLSHRRAQSGRPTLSLRQFDDDGRRYEPAAVAPGTSDPSRRAEKVELHQRLEAALQRLDEEFRVAVLLRDIEGLDYAAIAEILKVPVGTVKSRIHRGRLMLRELLQREEPQLGVG